uniref:Uncharacterized protein n=1 Tax=Micrurus paraensis TaxID=1970185 RepID=A0A2D4K0V8_9SAUR
MSVFGITGLKYSIYRKTYTVELLDLKNHCIQLDGFSNSSKLRRGFSNRKSKAAARRWCFLLLTKLIIILFKDNFYLNGCMRKGSSGGLQIDYEIICFKMYLHS